MTVLKRRAPAVSLLVVLVAVLAAAGHTAAAESSDEPAAGRTAAAGSAEPAAGGPAGDPAAEVTAVLAEQTAAWNRGDLEAFTAVYADDAAFVSPTGLTRGRAEVLARYRSRYPDRAAMGRLALEVIEVRPAPAGGGPGAVTAVSVVARWSLAYPAETERKDVSGLTLLVLHRRAEEKGGGWEIVQDASM